MKNTLFIQKYCSNFDTNPNRPSRSEFEQKIRNRTFQGRHVKFRSCLGRTQKRFFSSFSKSSWILAAEISAADGFAFKPIITASLQLLLTLNFCKIFWDSIFRHKYPLKSANAAVKPFFLGIVMRCT